MYFACVGRHRYGGNGHMASANSPLPGLMMSLDQFKQAVCIRPKISESVFSAILFLQVQTVTVDFVGRAGCPRRSGCGGCAVVRTVTTVSVAFCCWLERQLIGHCSEQLC
jgi:hypothetical protein